MSSSLQDIQLQIVLQVQGLSNVGSVSSTLSGVARAANNVVGTQNAIASVNRSSIRSWSDLTDQLGAVERRYDAVFRAGVHMTQMGTSLMGLSRDITGVLTKSVTAWGDFEFTLNRAAAAADIFTKTDLFANGTSRYDALKNAIYATSKELRVFPVADVAKGVYFWESTTGQAIKTQADLDLVMKGVNATMRAAAMTDTDYETAIKGVYSILQQYHLGLDKTTQVTGELMLMTQKTALEFPDLVNSFKMVGPIASANNISFEEMAQVMGQIGDAGIRGTMAGRALRQFFVNLVKPSKAAKVALDQVFDSTFHMKDAFDKLVFPKGKFVGLTKYIQYLSTATKGMTQQERNHLLALIATRNELPVLTALVDEQTRGIDKNKYSLVNAAAAFDKTFGMLKTSWRGVVGLLQQTVMPIVLEVGAQIAASLSPFLERVSQIAQKIQDWVQANPKLVAFGVKMAAIAAAALAAAGALFITGGAILFLIGNIGNFLQGIGKVMGPFAGLIGLVAGFTALVISNVGGLRDAFTHLGGSIHELVTSIMGDGFNVQKSWQSVFDAIRPLVVSASKIIAAGINHIADAIHALSQNKTFIDWSRKVIDIFIKYRAVITTLAIFSASMWAAGRAIRFVSGALYALSGAKTVVDAARFSFTLLKVAMSDLGAGVTLLKSAFPLLGSIMGSMTVVTDALAGAFAFMWDALLGPIGIILAAVALLAAAWVTDFGGIREITANVVNAVVGFVTGAVDWFLNTALPGVGNFIGGIVNFFAGLPGAIGDIWSNIVAGVGSFVTGVASMIGDFLKNLADNWSYYLGFILGTVIGLFIKIPFETAKFIVTMVGDLLGFLSQLPGMFANWFGQVWTDLTKWFATAIPAVAAWAGQMVTGIIDWIAKLPGRIVGWLAQVWSDVSTWFKNLAINAAQWASNVVIGIVKWFADMPGNALASLATFPGGLLIFFLKLPGLIWDSIVGIGKAIISGIWSGIQNMFTWLMDKVHGFFSGIIDGVKNILGIHSPSTVFAELGGHMIAGLATGIAANRDAHNALRDYTDGLVSLASSASSRVSSTMDGLSTDSHIAFDSSAEKVLRLELDISSSDGSVSSMTLDALKQALTGSSLVSALERMAEVS